MTDRPVPSPEERRDATRLCARYGVQPTDLTPTEWLEMAIMAESMDPPSVDDDHAWLVMGALAERFPGMNFR